MKFTFAHLLIMGVALIDLSQRAPSQTVLFTTANDFTGWTGYGFTVSTVTSPDLDGVSVNGLGNTMSAGSVGTAGSLRLFETLPFLGSAFAVSPNEATNSPFMSALLNAGVLTLTYQTVPPSNEGSLQILLAYRTSPTENDWYGKSPISTTITGDVATSIYDLTTGGLPGNTGWFQLGVGTFNNYDPSSPIYIDSIRISGTVPEPACGALVILGLIMGCSVRRGCTSSSRPSQ